MILGTMRLIALVRPTIPRAFIVHNVVRLCTIIVCSLYTMSFMTTPILWNRLFEVKPIQPYPYKEWLRSHSSVIFWTSWNELRHHNLVSRNHFYTLFFTKHLLYFCILSPLGRYKMSEWRNLLPVLFLGSEIGGGGFQIPNIGGRPIMYFQNYQVWA